MHFCYENIWWTGNKEVPLRHYLKKNKNQYIFKHYEA